MNFHDEIDRVLNEFSDTLRKIGCDECCVVIGKPDGNIFTAQMGDRKAVRRHDASTLYDIFQVRRNQEKTEVPR